METFAEIQSGSQSFLCVFGSTPLSNHSHFTWVSGENFGLTIFNNHISFACLNIYNI
jgi:hypothetical protein